MTATYLLPCTCGAKLEVTARQAGEMVRCRACERSQEVPPLRLLSQLETKAAEPARRASALSAASWDFRKGLILVGVLAAVINFGVAIYLHFQRPRAATVEEFRAAFDAMQPHETWTYWKKNILETGIQHLADPRHPAAVSNADITTWTWITCILGSVGVGLAVWMYLMPPITPRAPQATEPTPRRQRASSKRK